MYCIFRRCVSVFSKSLPLLFHRRWRLHECFHLTAITIHHDMFSSSDPSPKRKPSKRAFRPLGNKGKPGLAVDTSFSRHNAQAPQQVFPYESKTQELSFVSLSAAKALRKDKKGNLKQQLENRLPFRPTAQRSISNDAPQPVTHGDNPPRPGFARSQTTVTIPQRTPVIEQSSLLAVHKRIKGLRPSPLDLTHDVSPSDRAITIGLAIPSASLSNHATDLHSPSHAQHPLRRMEEVQTPTIIITPARADFGLSESPEALKQTNDYRPASSVYSRYTNCAPRHMTNGDTPPVPPLPLFIDRQALRGSAVTVFEEDANSHLSPRQSMQRTSQSLLPTPRQSRGWWNVITSPFSAGSKSNAFFWRSPSLTEDGQDRSRILDDASDMGTADPHAGVIFTNRARDDDELRTALPSDTGTDRPPMPKRSDTAPGALDANAAPINIYRVPSQGLAAAYYNRNRNFPSTILNSSAWSTGSRDLEGWSPSQSVAHPEDDRQLSTDNEDGTANLEDTPLLEEPASTERDVGDEVAANGVNDQEEGPFADSDGADADEPQPAMERNLFSTPSEDELQDATPPRPTLNDRSNTQVTMASAFSPLSETPIVEEAHTARFVGSSDNGELREVDLTPCRTISPPGPASPPGLGIATMSHRSIPHEEDLPPAQLMSEKGPYRPSLHSRNESSGSFGLGISDAGSEKELFPQPKLLSEKPRLGTDRFGQLTVRSVEDQRPSIPWWRRLFWLLVSGAAFLIVIAVVLLVVFVPGQKHTDMGVQASWLNTTGFPPMPTGIATVIRPNAVKEVSGCVSPQDLWSCAMPADQQQSIQPNQPDQPNFRLEIRFKNGTVPKDETQLTKRSSGAFSAGSLVRRDAWSSSLFTADPPAPRKDDQLFLGQYTDDVSAPYNGEETPFYISLLNSSALQATKSKLEKRHGDPYPYPTTSTSNSSTPSTNSSTHAASNIPKPALRENGEPAEAELYPFAEAQQLRLFNRGEADEHYGFYTYFDRSLYISNISASSSNTSGLGNSVTANSALDNASAVCTWSQTRLHVQIWTRKTSVSSLSDPIPLNGLSAANSTANDMTAPGSFPYPVTFTLDRHGGEAKKKGVYCYGLDERRRVVEDVKMWVDEDRAFGGSLVNPAAVPSSNGTSLEKRHDSEYGGVDGGSGSGCACQWQNWK